MAKKVDHEQRKREIAEKAVKLFSQVGYDNVSLIMIAAAAGVPRTVLYRYFCSKREILDAAILTVTGAIEKRCTPILSGRDTIVEKIIGVSNTVMDVMFENKDFLVAVFDFVVGMVRTGADMRSHLEKFTEGTRMVLRRLIAMGIHNGELPSVLNVDRASDAMYAEFEACSMRIILGTEKTSKEAKVRFADVMRAIAAWK